MKEHFTTIERSVNPVGRVIFEPGIHPLTKDAYKAIDSNFASGDLSQYTWNKEIAIRLKEYQPDILAIDGLDPNIQYAPAIWQSLPARPRLFTKRGSVQVLLGDATYRTFEPLLGDASFKNILEHKFASLTSATPWEMDGDHLVALGITTAVDSTSLAILLRNFLKNADEIDSRNAPVDFATPTERKLSRKSAILTGLLAMNNLMGLGNLAAIQAGYMAPSTTSEWEKEALDSYRGLTRDRLVSQDPYITGRTALLIAKAQDAVKNKPLTASVIFGGAHTDFANEYLQDPNKRQASIRTYAQELISFIDPLLKQFGASYQAYARLTILDTLSVYNIATVTDPQVSRLPHAETAIQNFVRIGKMQVCPEIAQALQPLIQ